MISQAMIVCGILLQLYNIYLSFRLTIYHRTLTQESAHRERALDYVVFTLINLFAVVYIIIFTMRIASIWIGVILFSGAIFVTVVLRWIYNLIDTEKKNCFDISQSLIGVIEARDPNLNGHSIHVQELCSLLYKHLPSHERKTISEDDLRYAALFHDVGKLGIPESILNKPGKLTDEEWDIMHRHPEISMKILKPLRSFAPILDWIKYHHERVDGKGYFKIKGNDIPLGARIIAIADTYSAIVMVRSYKPARTYEEAIKIIKEVSGTQLDAHLVDILCSIPKEEVVSCTRYMDIIMKSGQEKD